MRILFNIKHTTLLLFVLFFNSIEAQNTAVLDYTITNTNDTIYGTFKQEKLVGIHPKNKQITIHSLENVSTLRQNDVVYKRISSKLKKDKSMVYTKFNSEFISIEPKQPDFIKNRNRDSVFGRLKKSIFRSKSLETKDRIQVKIDKRSTTSYKDNNVIYDLKTIDTTILSVEKKVFLKRLIKGKVNLYEYRILRSEVGNVSPETFYIVEKNNQLFLIPNSNYKQRLIDLFIENTPLVDLIDDEFYRLENLYLIVKYYNTN